MQQEFKQPHLNTTLAKKHKKNAKFEKSSTNLLNSSPLYVLGLSIVYIDVFFLTLSLGYTCEISIFFVNCLKIICLTMFFFKTISFYYLLPKVMYD
jgi:hypothetical protein